MKPSNLFAILVDMRIAIQTAIKPTVLALLRSPILLLQPRELGRLFFSHVWNVFGDGIDTNNREIKGQLISPNACGVVLDLGAGHGHTAQYLSHMRVAKYVALEPNVRMHSHIRAAAERAGFSEDAGTLLILSCGAEDAAAVIAALDGEHTVDTIISVLTLCSVPRPEQALQALVDQVLKPGGQLIFFEHVASHRSDVLFWQKFWTPLWKNLFDGCVLYCASDRYIVSLGEIWEPYPALDSGGNRTGIWGLEGESDEHLFWHQLGRVIKRVV